MGGIAVRLATPDDLGVLSGLQWRWRVEEWAGEASVARRDYDEAMRSWGAGRLLRSHAVFLAADGEAAVGMAWLTAIERVPIPMRMVRRVGLVESVFVLPELRDRGVGSQLLRHVVGEARRLEYDHLLVHPSDRSVPFYRRHGFGGEGYFLQMQLRADGGAGG